MKKYILSLCTVLSIGQCYSMANPLDANKKLADLNNLIKSTEIENMYQSFFEKWNTIINEVTQYAIENSKNITGQDMNLISAATLIRDTNNHIINLCKVIQKNEIKLQKDQLLKTKLANSIPQLQTALASIQQKVNKPHITISKQNAQKVLQETIRILSLILNTIQEKLNDIPIEIGMN